MRAKQGSLLTSPARAFASACVVAALIGCSIPPDQDIDTPDSVTTAAAKFVGRQACASCHAKEHAAWQGSHHDLAMQEVSESTVLGDFDNSSFTYYDVTSTFFRRDGKFLVRTDGPDGELTEFEIAYTFGVEPLQQYLIAFPDGRYQALNVCWDTRPADEGGQRWFHLYPNENVDHEDELHWTGPYQNWNFMCAECHSTNVRKGYRSEEDRFETTWDEIDVSCESCHGPGSKHVGWAEALEAGKVVGQDPSKGLVVRLKDTDQGSWPLDPETGIAKRSVPRSSRTEIELCARCHSRRSVVSEDYVHGAPLMQTHRPALLTEELYYADGQIRDEVYVYGSFLQSNMYREGVTCKDCHDPHTLEIRGSVEAVCAQCHLAKKFDTPEHHFHKPTSTGASCIACHMPKTNYMVVDPRGDHSFRVPRPDLSVTLGTPNACNGCHADKTADWAAAAVAEHYEGPALPHYAEALHSGRRGLPGASTTLGRIVEDDAVPAIVRASALSLLRTTAGPESAPLIQRALKDDDPLVRLAALQASESFEPAARPRFVLPLLDDPIRTVRIEAGRVLAPASRLSLTAEQRSSLDHVLTEYRQSQRVNADRADAHLNLGLLHLDLGELPQAEKEYRSAIEREPSFLPAYVNLADLYRLQQRDGEGERVLRDGLEIRPDNAELHHALGLLLVRRKKPGEAIESLRQASMLRPDEVRYDYVYGVALHSTGRTTEALTVLETSHDRHPGDRDLLVALATINRDAGKIDQAVRYAEKLVELSPQDFSARQLLQQLEASRQ